MFLVSLDTLTQERNDLMIKIYQLLASQNAVKNNNELSDSIEHFQMCTVSSFPSMPLKRSLQQPQGSNCGKSNGSPQWKLTELQ